MPASFASCMLSSSSSSMPAACRLSVSSGTGPPSFRYSVPQASITRAIRPALCSDAVRTSWNGTPFSSLCQGQISDARPLIQAASSGPSTSRLDTWATRSKDTWPKLGCG